MIARGEIVRDAIKEKRFSVSTVADRIHISRGQLYLDFTNPHMSFDRIIAIGKVIDYDFSVHFKELGSGSAPHEDPAPYVLELQNCQSKLLTTQSQLIDAQQQLLRYQQKYGPVPQD